MLAGASNNGVFGGQDLPECLAGIEHYSNERTAQGFAIGITAIAAFQGYRYVKTQDWAPEWMKGETHNLRFSPMPSGGVLAAYVFRF